MARLFNKKVVLPRARWPSLSRLPLMTDYANSGSLVKSMCAGPCPREVGGGAGGRKTWQIWSLPSRFLKFHGGEQNKQT